MSISRLFLAFLKILLLLFMASMIKFQIPELRYDLGSKEPVQISSPNDLSTLQFGRSMFATVRGKGDFTKAATFSKYGVPYTYFLLEEYGSKLIVRTPERVSEEWSQIDSHVGRLRTIRRMPFSRSIRAGFSKLFDIEIPDDAFFLARDDVPRVSAWSIGAVSFVSVLWFGMAYFFFIHRHISARRKKQRAG